MYGDSDLLYDLDFTSNGKLTATFSRSGIVSVFDNFSPYEFNCLSQIRIRYFIEPYLSRTINNYLKLYDNDTKIFIIDGNESRAIDLELNTYKTILKEYQTNAVSLGQQVLLTCDQYSNEVIINDFRTRKIFNIIGKLQPLGDSSDTNDSENEDDISLDDDDDFDLYSYRYRRQSSRSGGRDGEKQTMSRIDLNPIDKTTLVASFRTSYYGKASEALEVFQFDLRKLTCPWNINQYNTSNGIKIKAVNEIHRPASENYKFNSSGSRMLMKSRDKIIILNGHNLAEEITSLPMSGLASTWDGTWYNDHSIIFNSFDEKADEDSTFIWDTESNRLNKLRTPIKRTDIRVHPTIPLVAGYDYNLNESDSLFDLWSFLPLGE